MRRNAQINSPVKPSILLVVREVCRVSNDGFETRVNQLGWLLHYENSNELVITEFLQSAAHRVALQACAIDSKNAVLGDLLSVHHLVDLVSDHADN